MIQIDKGSFRDPSGTVFEKDGRVLRAIYEPGIDKYFAFKNSGLMQRLVEEKKLVGTREVSFDELGDHVAGVKTVVEHDRIPFISYPYEWSFETLKSAALFHLDLQISIFEQGFTLSDASAYNVQFVGAKPIFIDILSFQPYREGEYWVGHRQFCDQFLNPLLLRSLKGVSHNAWYRGRLEGVDVSDLASLLTWSEKLKPGIFTNVFLQASLNTRASKVKNRQTLAKVKGTKLPSQAYLGLLKRVRRVIEKLTTPGHKTLWENYANDHSYSSDDEIKKRNFIRDFMAVSEPCTLWDIGCNSGDYSILALESGADYVVGFDSDQGALDAAFRRSQEENLPFLPLWMDGANPSPRQGWAQSERKGIADRQDASAIVALAIVHHLAIGANIPLQSLVQWLVGMAPVGVIEFVPKQDPMVQYLLQLREDIFDDYNIDAFCSYLGKCARIVKSETISKSGRTLYFYARDELVK